MSISKVSVNTEQEFFFDILCFVPYTIEDKRKIFVDAINRDTEGVECDSRLFSLAKNSGGEYVLIEDVIKYGEEFEITIMDQYYRHLAGIV